MNVKECQRLKALLLCYIEGCECTGCSAAVRFNYIEVLCNPKGNNWCAFICEGDLTMPFFIDDVECFFIVSSFLRVLVRLLLQLFGDFSAFALNLDLFCTTRSAMLSSHHCLKTLTGSCYIQNLH